jgi:cytochrome P450
MSEAQSAQQPEPASIVDFDLYDPEFLAHPEPVWETLRTSPGAWCPRYGGFHILSRYEDVRTALTESLLFSSADGVNVIDMPVPKLIPVTKDLPEHRDYRKILNPRMTRSVAEAAKPEIRSVAVELLDALPDGEEIDMVEAFTGKFPKTIAMRIIGYPEADLDQLSEWVEILLAEEKDATVAGPAFLQYVQDFVARRRREPLRDDLVSALVSASIQGKPLTDEDAVSMTILLTTGGLHTTSSCIGGMYLWFADHPSEYSRLRESPKLLATAVEEFIRYTSPAGVLARRATENTSLGGCAIAVGDKVVVNFAGANRDPEAFEKADEVMLERSPNRHIAFGAGPHRCVGSHYARAMVQIALEETVRRIAKISVIDRSKVRWAGGEARALEYLPMVINNAL